MNDLPVGRRERIYVLSRVVSEAHSNVQVKLLRWGEATNPLLVPRSGQDVETVYQGVFEAMQHLIDTLDMLVDELHDYQQTT